MNNLRQKVLSGVFWQGLSNIGSYGINFLISVILARLLTPEDFGIVAIIGVFTALFGVFVDSGFSTALIQKKNIEKADCSSVFFLNLVMAGVIYGILFFAAPWIAKFYVKPELIACIRVLALTIVISSISIVQGTLIYKKMLFHLNFRISLISLIISGLVGVFMAYRGFGVWALITQQLLKALLTGIMQWFWGKWIPELVVDFSRLKTLFQFGWKLFCSGLLDNFYNNIYPLTIGKLFNLSTLSYYNRGNHIPSLGMSIINSTIGSVLLPTFSNIQDDREKTKTVMQKALKNIMFLVIPCMTFFFISADPLVRILYGEKWLPCAPFLQIFSVIFLFYPLHTTNLNLVIACGRSDFFLWIEIIKKIQGVVCILLTFRYGPLTMASCMIITTVLAYIENSYLSRKLADYGSWEQCLDLLPMLLISIISGSVTWYISSFIENFYIHFIVLGIAFSVFYFLLSAVWKLIPLEIIELLKNRNSIKKVFTS